MYLCCGRRHLKNRDSDKAVQMTLLPKSKQNGFHDSKDGGINDGYNSMDEYEEDDLFVAPQRSASDSSV